MPVSCQRCCTAKEVDEVLGQFSENPFVGVSLACQLGHEVTELLASLGLVPEIHLPDVAVVALVSSFLLVLPEAPEVGEWQCLQALSANLGGFYWVGGHLARP